MRISVTGLGIVSAIGMDLEANHSSLLNLTSGISTIELLKGLEQDFFGGEIKLTNQQLAGIAFGEKQNELLRTGVNTLSEDVAAGSVNAAIKSTDFLYEIFLDSLLRRKQRS